jgi:hypothetical protein
VSSGCIAWQQSTNLTRPGVLVENSNEKRRSIAKQQARLTAEPKTSKQTQPKPIVLACPAAAKPPPSSRESINYLEPLVDIL